MRKKIWNVEQYRIVNENNTRTNMVNEMHNYIAVKMND